MYKIETRKDKIKIIRTILESAVLLTLVFAIVRTLNVNSVYIPYDPQDKSVVSGEECGFLAVSLFWRGPPGNGYADLNERAG